MEIDVGAVASAHEGVPGGLICPLASKVKNDYM